MDRSKNWSLTCAFCDFRCGYVIFLRAAAAVDEFWTETEQPQGSDSVCGRDTRLLRGFKLLNERKYTKIPLILFFFSSSIYFKAALFCPSTSKQNQESTNSRGVFPQVSLDSVHTAGLSAHFGLFCVIRLKLYCLQQGSLSWTKCYSVSRTKRTKTRWQQYDYDHIQAAQ